MIAQKRFVNAELLSRRSDFDKYDRIIERASIVSKLSEGFLEYLLRRLAYRRSDGRLRRHRAHGLCKIAEYSLWRVAKFETQWSRNGVTI